MKFTELKIKDESLRQQLTNDGVATLQIMNDDMVAEMESFFYENFKVEQQQNTYNYNSNADCSSDAKIKISNRIVEIFKPMLDKYFDNYKVVLGLFFVKQSSPDSAASVTIHHDPTLLENEHLNRHINFWCPLTEVDEHNGALHIIRGSHNFLPPVHALTIPFPYSGIDEELQKVSECIKLKAGEAMVFDNRLLHQSKPNLSGKDRISMIVTIVSADAEYISLYKDSSDPNAPIEVYAQNEGWHFHPSYANTLKRPKVGALKGYLNYTSPKISAVEFKQLLEGKNKVGDFKYRVHPKPNHTSANSFLAAAKNCLLKMLKF